MSVASKLRTALAEFNVPIEAVSHNKDAVSSATDTYMVFFIGAYAGGYQDDAPTRDTYEISLHLIAPYTRNTNLMRRQIRDRLFNAGFTYPRMTDATVQSINANDGVQQHIIFDFAYITGLSEADI